MSAARDPHPKPDKISAEFAARLDRSPSDKPVRSLLILETGAKAGGSNRQSRSDRESTVKAVKESARSALSVVDKVLDQLGGRRLSPLPDALGTIRVEATPEGLYRLTQLNVVRAVLEDQGIAPLPEPSPKRERRTTRRRSD